MKKRSIATMVCALMTLVFLGGCDKVKELSVDKLKKKEVSVEKLEKTIIESVTTEQQDSGRILTVDTIFLNKISGDNYSGELRGHFDDNKEVVFDLT